MADSLTPSGVFTALTQMEERISTRMELALNRVHDRIEESNNNATAAFREITKTQADHDREDAIKFATIESKAEASKGPGVKGWISDIVVAALGVGTGIAAMFAKSKGN